MLTYRTTNRDGYREYKSCGAVCAQCPYLSQCTESREHVKTVTRHIWEPYMETCEDIRQTLGMKDLYAKRKETIERLFGTAKENHGFRYKKGIARGSKFVQNFYFERNSFDKRKMALESKSQSRFVYSLSCL